MPLKAAGVLLLASTFSLLAGDEPQLKARPPLPPNGASVYRIAQGQRIPVKFLNSVTTRGTEGDRLFLQTVFPVSAANRIVIPARSYIDAQVTSIHRLDRGRDRAELYIQLGQLTLPGGVQRALRTDMEGARPNGIIAAVFTTRGGDVILAPGTTAEIELVDPTLVSADEVHKERR